MSVVDVRLSPETVAELRRIGIKPGVAYMPVPRCDTCRWWQPNCGVQDSGHPPLAYCHREAFGGAKFISERRLCTAADFGCVKYEATS